MNRSKNSHIVYENARFMVSAAQFSQCPPDRGAEIAFAGRSNAGKSSALNALTRQRKLARTSKTPGRTQLINFFSLDQEESYRLVDLPGYGYAKVPHHVKQNWQQHLDEYLRYRQSLKGIVLVMDIRHPLQEFDIMMIDWSTQSNMPLHILLTKADKLKKGPVQNTLLKVQKKIASVQELITAQTFSSHKQHGINSLKQQLDSWLGLSELKSAED